MDHVPMPAPDVGTVIHSVHPKYPDQGPSISRGFRLWERCQSGLSHSMHSVQEFELTLAAARGNFRRGLNWEPLFDKSGDSDLIPGHSQAIRGVLKTRFWMSSVGPKRRQHSVQ
jgi:hypothetical protein